jgi:hypothetical protein
MSLACCAFLICATSAYGNKIVIIVIHGTWAANAEWYRPGGEFFRALQKHKWQHECCVVPFTWSGKLNKESRKIAGYNLAQLMRSYPADTIFYIISHSHGSNVGIIASQVLARIPGNTHRITNFFAFGTPVHHEYYMPNMDTIGRFYNFFSYKDFVQTIFGFFSRTFPKHNRIANIRFLVDDAELKHKVLHDPILIRWLETLHEHIEDAGFSLQQALTISFYKDKKPHVRLDTHRKKLKKSERALQKAAVKRSALQLLRQEREL